MAFCWPALLVASVLLVGLEALAQDPPKKLPPIAEPAEDPNDLGPGYPRLNEPWKKDGSKKAPAKATPKPATTPATAVPAATPDTSTPSAAQPEAPPPSDRPAPRPRVRKNEVSVSGDFFLGQGNVTMPFGFSLEKLGLADIQKSVAKPDRTSTYYGGTVSYSYGQSWYLDLAYATGTSSGNADVVLGSPPDLPSEFTINDTWYQAYVRYTFPRTRGKPFSGYLRAGFSYVTADLTDSTVIPAIGLYRQTDKTEDLLGNFGFGLAYAWPFGRLRVGVQVEGEGFYGRRNQKSREVLLEAGEGVSFPTASIDNDLYGGIGRATLRFEYRFGNTGAFRAFADGGFQAKFTMIGYPGGLGNHNELLWGPYIKAGVRYSF